MGIIFKFILRNMKEKKSRTLLIVFSIMMSSALFFASLAMSGSVEKIIVDRIRNEVGSSEIAIYSNEKSPSDYLSMNGAERYREEMEYIVGCVSGSGIYELDVKESVRVNLNGYEMDELQKMNPVYYEQEYNVYPFTGKKIVINNVAASKLGLRPGDGMEIEINGIKHRFTVSGIALAKGLFLEDGADINALVPASTLAALYNVKARVNVIYMRPKDMSRKQELIDSLSKVYKRYTVTEAIPEEEIAQMASSFTVPFMMMVIMVMLISVFIIYTSFRVITTEMLPVIGTFRSIGATKKATDMVLIIESIAYGMVGGILGCIVGIGVLRLMAGMLITSEDAAAGLQASIDFTAAQLVISFIVAMLLSVVSSMIPIVRVSKISVKDIVLNKIESIRKRRRWKLWLGILMLSFALVVPRVAPRETAVALDMISLCFASVSITLLIPYITKGFIKVFEKIYIHVFGGEGVLAAKNLRENKSVLNNISLLAMGISALLIINTISFSVFKEVVNAYRCFEFDITMGIEKADRQRLKQVEKIEGVSDAYGSYSAYGVEVSGSKDRIGWIQGVESGKYLDFYDMGIVGDDVRLVKELDEDRNIIMAYAIKDKFNVDIGSSITLKTNSGERDYKVIGFCETIMNNGQMAIISDRYIKSDFGQKYYSDINIKTEEDPELVKERIKEFYKDKGIYIRTTAEMERLNDESNASLFNVFKIFSVMAMVIGVFGVLNNFAISFIERKRSLAMLRSTGMSKPQTIKMIFIEALSGGLVGGTVGALTGVISISIMPYILRAIDLPITMHYSAPLIISSILGGAVVTLVASISPALKSSKLNIIEAIKYE